MAIETFSIKKETSKEVSEYAKKRLENFNPKLIIFFASSIYDTTNPAEELKKSFPDCEIIGSTSHSEFCNSEFTSNSFTIMAIDKKSVEDCCVKVVTSLKEHPSITDAVSDVHTYFGGTEEIFKHFDKYVGIVLFEASAKSEEYFMDKLGMNTDILFVGGTSSTTENNISKVYANGSSYENAAVLAILKTVEGYDIIKTQSVTIFSDEALNVTKSDMPNRILYEFNNQPCNEVYARVLNVPKEKIQDYFVSNPLGVIAENEIFVRTFNEIVENGISLHCGIPEGTEIKILKIGNIIEDTKEALDRVITYTPAGVINFNCLYRTFEIQNKNLIKEYSEIFGKYHSIGFSTAGEAFLGHINETSTILVIK